MSGAEEEKAGFLARWSRRKLAPEPESAAEPPPAPENPPQATPPAAACPIPGGPMIDLASLPKLEELTLASDFTPFLRAGVPSALRNAALRRMWSLDPSIRDFINSVDYQWDFNTPGGLPHGFANELLGDVSKLLAQAVGDHPKPEVTLAEAEPTDPPGAPEAVASGEAPQEALRLGAPQPWEPAPTEPAPTEPAATEPARLEPAPQEPALPRRRHGAALPA